MEWIYSAVIVSILSGFFGLAVGAVVIRRVVKSGDKPKHVISWLLGAMAALALVQVMEQSRVLLFRLSYDGYVDRSLFGSIYHATWNVASSKIIAAVALTVAASVKLGLYLDYPEDAITRAAMAAAIGAVTVWAVLAVVLDVLF